MADGIQQYDMQGLLDALRLAESQGNTGATSHKGAMGDMQQMPETLRDPGYEIPGMADIARLYGMDPTTSDTNIEALARDPELARRWAYEYLTGSQRYSMSNDMDRLIGSYNRGISGVEGKTVDQYPAETRDYIGKVRDYYRSLTGQDLPQQGYSAAPQYQTIRPRPRGDGLLAF